MLAWIEQRVRTLRKGDAPKRPPLRPQRRRRPWWRIRALPSFVELSVAFGVILAVITANWLGLFSRVAADMAEKKTEFDSFGSASASVGDALAFNGGTMRLIGVSAPSRDVICHAKIGGQKLDCGAIAGDTLNALVRGREVRCTGASQDRHGRQQATCSVVIGGERVELGHYMVTSGWASADRLESQRYAMDEVGAHIHQIGLWSTDYLAPQPVGQPEAVAQLRR